MQSLASCKLRNFVDNIIKDLPDDAIKGLPMDSIVNIILSEIGEYQPYLVNKAVSEELKNRGILKE